MLAMESLQRSYNDVIVTGFITNLKHESQVVTTVLKFRNTYIVTCFGKRGFNAHTILKMGLI